MSDCAVVRRGICFVVAAPSGAGKSTITRALLDCEPQLRLSVSVTTRSPRQGEAEGVHYLFRSEAEFAAMLEGDVLLEHATVFGKSYGTPRAPVEQALASGLDVIFDVDWQGWRQIRAAMPEDAVGLFIMPPSLAALRERLAGRRTDGPEEIARRMRAAIDEISHWGEFDHVLVNDSLPQCISGARAVLQAARCTVARSLGVRSLVACLSR